MKKTIFAFILILSIYGCHKDKKGPEPVKIQGNPSEPQPTPCLPWLGKWKWYAGDSTVTDTLVTSLKEFIPDVYNTAYLIAGPEGQRQVVYYSGNLKMFEPWLGHYCPLQLSAKADSLRFFINSKNYYFYKLP